VSDSLQSSQQEDASSSIIYDTAEEAAVKKLQATALPFAFWKLGQAAYAERIGLEQFTELYQTLDAFNVQVVARRAMEKNGQKKIF
jgi:hypothetical protein